MDFDVFQGALYDFALALVNQLGWRFLEWQPERPLDFNAHLGRDLAEPAGAVQQQIKADDLEDASVVAPVPNVVILDVSQLANEVGVHTGFLSDLADSGLVGLLTVVNRALRQGNERGSCRLARLGVVRGLFRTRHVRLDNRHEPAASHLPQDNAASRELAHHKGLRIAALVWQRSGKGGNATFS